MRCVLLMPAFDPEWPNRKICLDCRTRVVRVELAGPAQYGVALNIESYRVVVGSSGE